MSSADFGAELRRLRKQKGWSQEELADRAGVDQTSISQFERGKHLPAMERVARLAKAFGMEPEEMARLAGHLPPAPATPPPPRLIVVQTRHGQREVDFAAALAALEAFPDEYLHRDIAEWRATMSPEAFERHVAELYAAMRNSGEAFRAGISVANGAF